MKNLAISNTRKEVGLWEYVRQSNMDSCSIDRDRAMEYMRRNTPDVKVFKLVNLGATIAFNQMRSRQKDVLGFYADFYLDPLFKITQEGTRAVTVKAEIRLEPQNSRDKERSKFFEYTLIVNERGEIVDVDYQKLQVQLKSLQPMRY